MSTELPILQHAPVHIRHIAPSGPGGTWTGSKFFTANRRGVNGAFGFAGGTIEPRLCEEGTLSIKFPNADSEGTPHRERFEILKRGKVTPLGGNAFFFKGGSYRPGDEWIEVWVGEPPTGECVMVATPTQAVMTPSEITLNLQDGFFLSRKVRETAAGNWFHAPRDAFEYYSRAWTPIFADGFSPANRAIAWSSAATNTSDSKLTVTRAETDFTNEPGTLRLRPGAASTQAQVAGNGSAFMFVEYGTLGADQDWRGEATFRLRNSLGTGQSIVLSVGVFSITIPANGVTPTFGSADISSTGFKFPTGNEQGKPGLYRLAIEARRGRWVYFYVNGALVGVGPMFAGSNIATTVAAFNSGTAASAATDYVSLENILMRTVRGFLMKGTAKGDYTLPGAFPADGFMATYYSLTDIVAKMGVASAVLMAGNPTQQPYARRVERMVNNPTAGWHPLGPAGGAVLARHHGAMNLDLANYDYRFRITYTGNRIRVGIGKTFFKDLLYEGAGTSPITTGWVKANGGLPAQSGWVPFLFEYINVAGNTNAGGGYIIEYQRSDDGAATWTTVGNDIRVQVSPLGLYINDVRYESHYDQIQKMKEAFGLQWRVDARSLESGQFPGEMLPRTRVGRDTAKVLDSIEAADIQTQISAENVADVLVVEGAGVGDSANAASTVTEAINFDELDPGDHFLIHSEYESLSDINIETLLQQRAASLLGLRGAPWEEVSAKPRGHRELLDAFPLKGQLAELKWEPGDGARLSLPEVGVVDSLPRQMLGVSRDFQPDGMGPPTIKWRQRPRGWADTLRKLMRQVNNADRNYQGDIYTVQGSHGATPAQANYADLYTRLSIPLDAVDLLKLEFVVITKSDTSARTIQVNGVNTTITYGGAGRFDVTDRALGVSPGPLNNGYMYATINGGTGTDYYYLEATVRRKA